MVKSQSQLTLEEFLALPDDDVAYELIDGQAVPKMSPKFFHSTVQKLCYSSSTPGVKVEVELSQNGQ